MKTIFTGIGIVFSSVWLWTLLSWVFACLVVFLRQPLFLIGNVLCVGACSWFAYKSFKEFQKNGNS